MARDHEEGAVSRRRFLRVSAATAATLGAGALWGPGIPPAAAAPASPLEPPDELLVTVQFARAVDQATVNNAVRSAPLPSGWALKPLAVGARSRPVLAFPGRLAGGPPVTFTVVRYAVAIPSGTHNLPAGDRPAMVAAGSILANRPSVQAKLPPGVTLVSATPNWAVTAAPSGFVEGGPGGLPAADGVKDWRFQFPDLAPNSPLLSNKGTATVVVLDTAPIPSELLHARGHYSANKLLDQVVTQLTEPGHWLDVLGPAPVMPFALQRPCTSSPPYPAPYHPYRMADHGLFAAGIVGDIAPHCDLRIIRVLNRWGAGYLSDLLAGLAVLARTPLKAPVVANMSLTVRMPSIEELLAELGNAPNPVVRGLAHEWLPQGAKPPLRLEDACAPLGLILGQLAANGVFLVAATGNDSGTGTLRDPCAPAAFDSTLGVAAVAAGGAPACYSNRGDDRAAEGDGVLNGMATFGGDGGGMVHGLYSAPQIYLPPAYPAPPNAGGWAQWMGTSFASPVIAALAANYIAASHLAGTPTDPATVRGALQAAGTPPDPTLQVPTIKARQV